MKSAGGFPWVDLLTKLQVALKRLMLLPDLPQLDAGVASEAPCQYHLSEGVRLYGHKWSFV
jgi:hypothetical protein